MLLAYGLVGVMALAAYYASAKPDEKVESIEEAAQFQTNLTRGISSASEKVTQLTYGPTAWNNLGPPSLDVQYPVDVMKDEAMRRSRQAIADLQFNFRSTAGNIPIMTAANTPMKPHVTRNLSSWGLGNDPLGYVKNFDGGIDNRVSTDRISKRFGYSQNSSRDKVQTVVWKQPYISYDNPWGKNGEMVMMAQEVPRGSSDPRGVPKKRQLLITKG
jgi:hypothetical protein